MEVYGWLRNRNGQWTWGINRVIKKAMVSGNWKIMDSEVIESAETADERSAVSQLKTAMGRHGMVI